MIGCIDVHYYGDNAQAALVCFDDWGSAEASSEHIIEVHDVAPYVPGEFFRRELPCVLSVLTAAPAQPDFLIVDGYVWLGLDGDGSPQPGLGAYLFEALDSEVAIIGAAKTLYKDASAIPVFRGTSLQPLYVSAAGINDSIAAEHIRNMHGKHRLPTMLKRVDKLARSITNTPKK